MALEHAFCPRPADLAALLVVLLCVFMLKRERAGLQISTFSVGTTPVTAYQLPHAPGTAVVVAHAFAGSRQITQACSLHLAQRRHRVLAFDFDGHGRTPVPMSGDVTGTTQLLVAEARRVIAAARALRAGARPTFTT